MKKISIKETMFGGGVTICIGKEEEFVEFFNNKYDENLEADGGRGMFYRSPKADMIYDKKIHNYIWLKSFNKNDIDDLDTLLHEIEHFVVYELKRRGIYLYYIKQEPQDEVFAYFCGHVGSRILTKLLK